LSLDAPALDTAALEAWLAEAAQAERVEIREAAPLSGGAIQENWRLDAVFHGGPSEGRRELVLRTDAASSVATSHSRPQEFALLQAAAGAGVTVPEPLWCCADRAVLGRAFYVMARAPGVALGPKVVKDESLGGDREALAERLGRELARIHSIRPPRPDLAFLPLPEGAAAERPALADIALYRRYLDALGQPRPALEWGLAWAERQAPRATELVLLHRDFRTGNYLVDAAGLTAILDWEFAGWGDPMCDLGWFTARCWRFGRPDREAGGIGSRAAFYRGYRAESGRAIDEAAVAYWEVLAHIRWAVIALLQGHRHWSGQEASLELALTGRMAAELELAVLSMTAPETWRTAHA
jgi:aminoglycoside phosphotransferase (APT) family kinase protein